MGPFKWNMCQCSQLWNTAHWPYHIHGHCILKRYPLKIIKELCETQHVLLVQCWDRNQWLQHFEWGPGKIRSVTCLAKTYVQLSTCTSVYTTIHLCTASLYVSVCSWICIQSLRDLPLVSIPQSLVACVRGSWWPVLWLCIHSVRRIRPY